MSQTAPPGAVTPAKKARRFPIQLLDGVRPLDRKRIPVEIVAGVTLAALAIPEVMGYTSIAGMPVITGLYTILMPITLFALFGSSKHLVVGADSATAAIMAAGLAGLAAAGLVRVRRARRHARHHYRRVPAGGAGAAARVPR